VLAALIVLVAFGASSASARDGVPLPKPRPAAAPAAPSVRDAEPPAAAADSETEPPQAADAKPVPAEPPPPSACRLALTDTIATAPSIPDITGPGGCGGPDLVKLEAIMLPDGSRVAVTPAAILRCPMARALADWVRTDIAALAAAQGSRVADLDNFDSYECRGRNRVRGAKLSEHGRANALDVRGVKLANGRMLALTDREVPREVRETVLQSVCARFTTVLGPGSDGYHEDHIHLDLAERRGGYRICQWDLYEPLPAVAPLLPAERPAEAPPRDQVAGEDQGRHQEQSGPAAAEGEARDAAPASPAEAEPEQSAPPVTASKPAKPTSSRPATAQSATSKPKAMPKAMRKSAVEGAPVDLTPPRPTKKRRDDRRF
jgi:hypothetical protein